MKLELRSLLLKIAALGIAAACFTSFGHSQNQSKQEGTASDVDEICLAIFRYELETKQARNAAVIFLSVDGKDPSDELMKHFESHKPLVRKTSLNQFKRVLVPAWIADKKSGKLAVEYLTGDILWLNSSEVKVEGGYYCGGRCAASGVFHVVKRKGQWVVRSFVTHYLS